MATKVGEAYYSVGVQLDQSSVDKARAAIGKQLSDAVDKQNQAIVKSNKDANDQIVADDVKTNNERTKNDESYTKTSTKNSTARRSAFERDIQGVRKAENDAYAEDVKRSNAQSILSKRFGQDTKDNEGALHKLATQFRTIGTVSKGIGIAAGVLSGFSLLEDTMGGIAAAAPIAAAGIALIPAALTAVGVEAVVLKGAFNGVGKAIKDSMNPANAKAFAADMKSLSPSARSFVTELLKAKGVLPNIQQTFFSASSLQKAAGNVKTFFQGISANFKKVVEANGNLFGQLLGTATNKASTGASSDFLGNLAKALKGITPGLTDLESGLITFVDNVSKNFGNGSGISKVLSGIGNFLKQINTKSLFSAAGIAVKAFGDVLKNIGGSINGIIKAFGGTKDLGATFFKNIGGIFKEINQFANSPAGQKFLKDLVGTLNSLSSLSDTVIKQGLEFLGSAFAGLYPAIHPFVQQVQTLVKNVFTPAFGKLIGNTAQMFLKLGTNILKTLNPAIKGIINFLVAHPKVFDALAIGVVAVYTALKVTKGVNSLANQLQAVNSALSFFKNPKQIIKGMAETAAGEDAIGKSSKDAAGAKGVAGLGVYGLAAAVIYLGAGLTQRGGFKAFNGELAGMGKGMEDLAQGKTGGFSELFKSFNKLESGDLTTRVFEGFIGPIKTFFTKDIPGYFDTARHALASFFDGFASTAASQWSDIKKNVFNPLGNFVTKTIPGWFDSLGSDIAHVFNVISNRISGWWKNTTNLFDDVKTFFTKTVPGWFDTYETDFAHVFNTVSSRLSGWWKNTTNLFNNDIKPFFTKTIPGWFTTFGTDVAHVFNDSFRRISGYIGDVKKAFNAVSSFITKTVPGWFGSAGKVVELAMHNTVKGITDIWSKIGSAFSGPIDFVITKVLGATNGLTGAWNAIVGAIPGVGKHLTIPKFTAGNGPGPISVPNRAEGGSIPKGLGGPTQDNVHLQGTGSFPTGINVSGGEYVLRADAVSKIQEQAPGYLDSLNKADRWVSGDPSAIHISGVNSVQKFAGGGHVPIGGTGSGSFPSGVSQVTVAKTLNFLKSIAGRIPYVLGANGPNAYDCSSLVGNVWARLTGNAINRRYFVTGTEAGWLLNHGFARGADPSGFEVGLTSPPEHTVGILAGHRFEAAHTGTRMRFDDGAGNAQNFAQKFHMVGLSGLGGGFLSPFLEKLNKLSGKAKGYLQAAADKPGPIPGKGTAGNLVGTGVKGDFVNTGGNLANTALAKAVAAAKAAAASGFGAGTALGNVGSGQIAQWIAEASKFANIPASWVPGIETIIRRESGGNPNAINRTDINAQHGDPSRGLMQTIATTFNRYHAAGTSSDIYDPVANIAAAVNYIHARYGTIFNVQQADPNKPPHGYEAGGPVLFRDHGGPVPPGISTVYNGTGANEYVINPSKQTGGGGHCVVHVSVDGVDVTSRAHVTMNNKKVAASLDRRSK